LEAVFEIEALTNDRLRQEAGDFNLVSRQDWVTGPGAGYIMAAFTHLNPRGSRFSDGTWGVYYAAHELETAVAETSYHPARFMASTRENPMNLEMRVLAADLKADLHDIRGPKTVPRAVYDSDHYSRSQELARRLRKENSWGIVYRSVRRTEGENVAVFRPRAL